jgi:hypothetical protein
MIYNAKNDGKWDIAKKTRSHPIALGAHFDHLLAYMHQDGLTKLKIYGRAEWFLNPLMRDSVFN